MPAQQRTGFQGSNIYSLVAGMYPILADNTHVGPISRSAFSRQSMSAAPVIYNVIDDPTGLPPLMRQPYLQGNFIMQTEATSEVATIRSQQETEDLIPEAVNQFPSRARALMMATQAAITGNASFATSNTAQGAGAAIESGGRSAEEMIQPGGSDFQFVPSGQAGLGEGRANQPDLYNPITDQYVNVTQQRLDSASGGHGVYGQGGRNMVADIGDIRQDMINGVVTEEEGYDAITQRGMEYFRMRAADTWNPFIRDAREQVDSWAPASRNDQQRMARMREVMLSGNVGPAAAVGGQTVASQAVTNYASVGARTMTAQHLGNRTAMFAGGMLETYPIGPYTFGLFGPFTMRPGTDPDAYTYYTNKIGGYWYQNYYVSSPSEAVTGQSGTAASDARLRHAAWVTKSHDSGARRAAIGGLVSVGISANFTGARRLRPEIDLVNASEQMSNAIDGVVQTMTRAANPTGTVPAALEAILRSHTTSFSVNASNTMNGRHIWAAPYISIFGQQYSAGTPV